MLLIINNKSILRIGVWYKLIYPSIDKLLNIVDSKYRLVHIVARRSKEMSKDNCYQLQSYVSKKNIGKALEEVSENLIIPKNN